MTERLHISSIVVTADPAQLNRVKPAITNIPIADIAVTGKHGKLIVTLETPTESEMVQALTDIQLLPGVASAALVYHQTTNRAEAAELADVTGRSP